MLSAASIAQQAQIQIWSAGFGPSKNIKVKNPRFVWQVWADGSAKITAASFTINGKEVDAKYDNRKKELFFDSNEPMAPGTYSVVAKVKVDDWAKFDKKWTVTIRPDARPIHARYSLLIGLAAGSVFFIRNLILTANPIAPFLSAAAPHVTGYRAPFLSDYVFDPHFLDEGLGASLLAVCSLSAGRLMPSPRRTSKHRIASTSHFISTGSDDSL